MLPKWGEGWVEVPNQGFTVVGKCRAVHRSRTHTSLIYVWYKMIPQAGAITGALYELFQIVFKMRQEAGLAKKVQNSSQVQSSPKVSNGK